MRVIAAQFMQESNSFSPLKCGMQDFRNCFYDEGEDLINSQSAFIKPLKVMYDRLDAVGIEVIPVVSAVAWSCGPVDVNVAERILELIQIAVSEHGPIDGVVLVMHGAMALEHECDGEGWLLSRIRNIVGENAVIAVSLDFHANLTRQMIKCADILCGYHTYPHVDMKETALRAVKLAIRMLRGEINPYTALIKLPMIHQAEACLTTQEPMKSLMELATAPKAGVYDVSVFQMQPWLDAKEGGASVLVTAKSRRLARQYADEIARAYWARKDALAIDIVQLEDAFRRLPGKHPIILADSADSPTAGSPGSSACILEWVLANGQQDIIGYHTIVDAASAEQAWQLSEGDKGRFQIGQQKVGMHAEVMLLRDEPILIPDGVYGKGETLNVGKSALLRYKGCHVLVISLAVSCCYPKIYESYNLDLTKAGYIVVKSATQYKVYYASLAVDDMITVDTTGPSSANLTSFQFQKLPRPIHPFDNIKEYIPEYFYGRNKTRWEN